MLNDRLRASAAIMQADQSARRHIGLHQSKLRPPEITHNAKSIDAKKNGIDPFDLGLGMQPAAINPDQTKWKGQKHDIRISIKHDRDRAGHPKHEGDIFLEIFRLAWIFQTGFFVASFPARFTLCGLCHIVRPLANSAQPALCGAVFWQIHARPPQGFYKF